MGAQRGALALEKVLDVMANNHRIPPVEVQLVMDQLKRNTPSPLKLYHDPMTVVAACLFHQRYFLHQNPRLSVAPLLLVTREKQEIVELVQELGDISHMLDSLNVFTYSLEPVVVGTHREYLCPRRAHDLIAQWPTAKPATQAKIDIVECMGDALRIGDACPSNLRRKVQVRNCIPVCKFRSRCLYYRFQKDVREGRHKLLICSTTLMRHELQKIACGKRSCFPPLGYTIFADYASYQETVSSGERKVMLYQQQIGALLDRCEMESGSRVYDKKLNQKWLDSIRKQAGNVFSHTGNDRERIIKDLSGLQNILNNFLQTKTYPFERDNQMHFRLLRLQSQVDDLLGSWKIAVKVSGTGHSILSGEKTTNAKFPERMKVVVVNTGNHLPTNRT